MALVHETGRVVIRLGLDEEGDEVWGFEMHDVVEGDAYPIVRLVGLLLEQRLLAQWDQLGDPEDD